MAGANPNLGNLTDERHLREVLDNAFKRLTKLETDTLPFTVNQQGPLPGTMRSIQIGDVGQAGSMWMRLMGNLPGQAPYQAVTDTAGTTRVEIGNLAVNGVSPAQYGFRANKADGSPIFDSLGLIAVMSQLGATNNSNLLTFTTTTPTVITNMSLTFSLARQARILISAIVVGFSSGQTGLVDIDIDSAVFINAGLFGFQWGVGGPSTTESQVVSTTLAAGSHTVDLRAYLSNTPGTFTHLGSQLFIWLLGT